MSLKQVCRACLTSGKSMYSTSDSIVPKIDSPPNSVVAQWDLFSKLLIATEDSLPDKICIDCLFEIQRTYSFMLKCERSEDILKKMRFVEIRLKRLENVSTFYEHNSSKNIISENDMYPHISQIKEEILEWNDRNKGNGEEDTKKGQLDVVSNANVNSQVGPRPENIIKGEVLPVLTVKQEPELDILAENGEIKEFEPEDHSSAEIMVCPGCSFECRMMENLEKHIVDNHMEGQKCKLCNQEFKCSTIEHCFQHVKSTNRKRNLAYHVRSHTGDLFICEICLQTFLCKDYLMKHIRCHTGERPFKCESCPKAFLNHQSLKYHVRSHKGKGPYKCKTCPKAFFYKQSLVEHVRRHTGELFKCELCPKTFQRKFYLMEHLKGHNGERPFKCEICSKAFHSNQSLMYHLKCHTGVLPFICQICPKAFRHKRSLVDHVQCHAEERPFKCENCPKAFPSYQSLMYHLRRSNHSNAKVVHNFSN